MITWVGVCGGSLCPLLAGGRHYRSRFNEAVTLLMKEELQILPVCIALLCPSLFAALNHLPEVPDHHADPDPRPPAVRCAAVPHRRGIAKPVWGAIWGDLGFFFKSVCVCRGTFWASSTC